MKKYRIILLVILPVMLLLLILLALGEEETPRAGHEGGFEYGERSHVETEPFPDEPDDEQELEQGPETERPDFDFETYYENSFYIILAYYEVEKGMLGEVIIPDINMDLYYRYEEELDYTLDELIAFQEELYAAEKMWEIVSAVIPPQYLERVAYFEVFTDGADNYLGAIENLECEDNAFILSLDINDMLDSGMSPDYSMLLLTIAHELGHIVTLGSDQAEWCEEEDADPLTYYVYEYDLDTFTHSYLNRFYQEFWFDIYDEWSEFYYSYGILYVGDEYLYEQYQEILNEHIEEFYNKYRDRFITDYAATSPVEDIAETFMYFVLFDPPRENLVRDRKILFFYDYPELVEIRDHFQNYLEENNILPGDIIRRSGSNFFLKATNQA